MKITKSQLRQVIKEESERTLVAEAKGMLARQLGIDVDDPDFVRIEKECHKTWLTPHTDYMGRGRGGVTLGMHSSYNICVRDNYNEFKRKQSK